MVVLKCGLTARLRELLVLLPGRQVRLHLLGRVLPAAIAVCVLLDHLDLDVVGRANLHVSLATTR